jgi:hypothetical protein
VTWTGCEISSSGDTRFFVLSIAIDQLCLIGLVASLLVVKCGHNNFLCMTVVKKELPALALWVDEDSGVNNHCHDVTRNLTCL